MICTIRARRCPGLLIVIPFILFLSCSHALAQEAVAVDAPHGTVSTVVTEDFEAAGEDNRDQSG